MLSLFEVLAFDERIVVLSNPAEKTIFTWNQANTIQIWRETDQWWEEIAIRTLSKPPRDFREAKHLARVWHFGG